MSSIPFELYLTPAAISYLTEIALSGLITIYLGLRLRRSDPNRPTRWLVSFFASTTLMLGLSFGDVGLAPSWRVFPVFLLNTAVAFCLLFLLVFAYNFPRLDPRKRWEFLFVLSLALFYLSAEAWFALVRYGLLSEGKVIYRTWSADYMLAGGFAWVPLVFLRQALFADPRPIGWWLKLRQLQGNEARAARSLAAVFLVTLALTVVNVLRAWSIIPTALFQLSITAGLMLSLFATANIYLSALPEETSFMVKLSGATLTILLLILSGVGWVIAPVHVAGYQPTLPEQQTLRFTPGAAGGYTVTRLPLRFESDLGQRLESTNTENETWQVAFEFPFFGQAYSEVYITPLATVSLGEKFSPYNPQFRYGTSPTIYLLNTRLAPEASGGVYARDGGDKLTITWLHLPMFFQREKLVTVQAVLYADGVIEMNFSDLPSTQVYILEADPYDSYWLTGVTPGDPSRPPMRVDYTRLPQTSDARGLVQDHYLEFRRHVHQLMHPLAALILVGSLLCVVGIPLMLYFSIVRPLNTLMAGAQQVNAGQLEIAIPAAAQDEIGFLAQSFNGMVARLRELIYGLEAQVAERTAELQRLATTDELTGLANRRHLLMVGSQAFKHAQRYRRPLAALMIDIDHFKQVNDRNGHRAGDRLLKALGTCLQENVRAADIVGRYGGEEFVLLLPETDLATAQQLAERLLSQVRALTIPTLAMEEHFTVSIGIAALKHTADIEVETLINRADHAMYAAKDAGRDQAAVDD